VGIIQLGQQMGKGVDAELHIVTGGGLKRVMADATVFAPHEQHGLGHDFVQFHGVMPCATGHREHRNA
jgi:hypothetical protein